MVQIAYILTQNISINLIIFGFGVFKWFEQAPKMVQSSQSTQQLIFKPSKSPLTFENASISSQSDSKSSKSDQQSPENVPVQNIQKQSVSQLKNPQSKAVQFKLKQEDEQVINDNSLAESNAANEKQAQNSDYEDEEEVTEHNSDLGELSQNSGCGEGKICLEEKKTLIRQHILNRRKKEKSIIVEKRFKCSYCPKQQNHMKTLNDHIYDVHSIETKDQFLCQYYAKGYKKPDRRDTHEWKFCPNRPDHNKKIKSPYQSLIDRQYSFIFHSRNKNLKKN